ncbi:MAG TPA: DUF2278 family protein, partial [Burkholderiaceae bacterium]
MHFRYLLGAAFVALAAIASQAYAALPTYGYVKGTFKPGSNKLEPLSRQGTFLHYHFVVQTPQGEYEAVIDVKKGNLYPFPQRIVPINNPALYGPVFNAADGYHAVTMNSDGGNPADGALDYLRHPGILADVDHEWTSMRAQPTANPDQYALPEWDALFVGVQKIYAFGQPYANGGKGVHVVHQNQGDKKAQFYNSNGLYQDGAVIFEYANGERKLLMTRFDDQPNDPGQADFSWDYDPDGIGPMRAGVARTPMVMQPDCSSYQSEQGVKGCIWGPFVASQIEAIAQAPWGRKTNVVLSEGRGDETSLARAGEDTTRGMLTSIIDPGGVAERVYKRAYARPNGYQPVF